MLLHILALIFVLLYGTFAAQGAIINETLAPEKLISTNIADTNASLLPISKNATNQLILPILSITDEKENTYYCTGFQLAQSYFNQALFHESLATLNLLNRLYSSWLKRDLIANFLQAVNLTLIGRYNDAAAIYEALLLNSNNIEIAVWSALNQQDIPKVLSMLKSSNLKTLIADYPDLLYQRFIQLIIEVSIAKKNHNSIEILGNMKVIHDPRLINTINYYRATVSDDLTATRLLQIITQDLEDTYNYVRSELMLVQILRKQNTTSLVESISRLKALSLLWYGGYLEQQVLQLLVEYYQQNHDPVNALKTYISLLNCPEISKNDLQITTKINKLYKQIFLASPQQNNLSTFQLVALFYEFSNFIPIGSQGDDIALNMAKHLINLGLFKNASELLQHQIQYRLRGEKKVITADHLALLHIMEDEPEKAIELLHQTDNENTNYLEYLRRLRIKAKAYLMLKQYDQALKLIAEDEDLEAKILKTEIFFQNHQWQEYITLNEQILLEKIRLRAIDDSDRQNVLRLAICYFMTAQQQKLELLEQEISTEEYNLRTAFKFLSTTTQNIDPINFESKMGNTQVQALMEKYKQILFY